VARVTPSAATGAELVRQRLAESIASKQAMLDSDCVRQAADVASLITVSLTAGGKVIFFGNGGSASDASHLAGELLGRFAYDRPALAAVCLSDHTAALSAIGNDYDYGEIFARQLRGLGAAGDVAVGLTTSGNSENVVRALEAARSLGLVTVALTGAAGGKVTAVADVCVRVPTDDTPRVQEACLHLGHTICELVERALHPPPDPAPPQRPTASAASPPRPLPRRS
jgi:D-sedoheptulose 7-phosphate isomerase